MLHDATGKVMALGVRTLAMIWDAARKAGGGAGNGRSGVARQFCAAFTKCDFRKSATVNEIEQEIAQPTPLGG